MDTATQALARWALQQADVPEDEIGHLLEVLRKGSEKGESDSVEMVAALLRAAGDAAPDHPEGPVILALLSAKERLDSIDRDLTKVDAMHRALSILESPAPTRFAARLAAFRAGETIEGLG